MDHALSLLWEIFPQKSHFTVDDIPDLTGKVVIVTGGNAGALDLCSTSIDRANIILGIGKETAKVLSDNYIGLRFQLNTVA